MNLKRIALASALSLAVFGASAAEVAYTIDPTHTVVLATWNHMGYSNPSANLKVSYSRRSSASSTSPEKAL